MQAEIAAQGVKVEDTNLEASAGEAFVENVENA
jgi:hypothetical protein